MNENNETKTINEEELEQVTGGVGATWDCWFDGGGSKWTAEDGIKPAGFEFGSVACRRDSCFNGLTQCACHGTDRCVGKMHKMDKPFEDEGGGPGAGIMTFKSAPYPQHQYNHMAACVWFLSK